jgi:uncharacterized protein (DUF305 family)
LKRSWGLVALAVLTGLAVAGCAGAEPSTTASRPAASAAAGDAPGAVFNGADVMFLQMSLEHIKQGDRVVALAEKRAADSRIRDLTAELRKQWRTEAATMTRWLQEWKQPLTADPDAGAHAGHGDLHSLRPSDIAELEAADGAEFDRTALSLLVGHLHNCVETTRMETGSGRYGPAISLAAAMTRARQSQIQTMLTLLA